VADGGEIPVAMLRDFAELALRSELVAGARALLDAAAPTKKGSCEMQRDGVEMQVGDPNAV